MELDMIRKELDNYDNIIKNMLVLRLALIPIVADIKIKNDLPLFQGKREDEIYRKIELFSEKNGVSANLVKDIYKLIIANALKIEEDIAEDSKSSILNNDKDISKVENVKEEFKKLDNIVEKEIPEILENITRICEKENLNLNQIATLYYNDKTNSEK